MLSNHYGREKLTDARLKMAQIPKGANLIPNPVSGAPGYEINGVYVLAGVPEIMAAMLDNLLPSLKGGDVILSATVTCKLPESRIAKELYDIQDKWKNVEIGSYPNFKDGDFGVSIVLRSAHRDDLMQALQEVQDIISKNGVEFASILP